MSATPRDRRSASTSKMPSIENLNNERSTGRRRLNKLLDGDPETAYIKSALQNFLIEMKKDQVYMAKNVLAAARMDLNRQYVYWGGGQAGESGVIYDEESPFKDMKNIQVPVSNGAVGNDVFRFKVLRYTKPNTLAPPITIEIPKTLAKVTPDIPLPKKCRAYTTLRNNIIADNEEEMRYLPYFGENVAEDVIDDLDLSEIFVDKTKFGAEEGKVMEYAAMYGIFLDQFLTKVDVSLDAVIQYLIGDISQIHGGKDFDDNSTRRAKDALPEDFNIQDPKINAALQSVQPVEPKELELAEKVCRVWKATTKISLWEVVKKTSRAIKNSLSPAKHTTVGATVAPSERCDIEVAALTGGNPWPYSLDSYASLNCLICYMHECPFHGTPQSPKFPKDSQESSSGTDCNHEALPAVSRGESRADSSNRSDRESSEEEDDDSDDNEYKLSIHIPGWSYSSKQAMKDAFAEDELCSKCCFKMPGSIEAVIPRPWSQAQTSLLRSSAGVLRNNPRCACLCAAVINKPCAEVYIQLREDDLLPTGTPEEILEASEAVFPEPIKILKRKKTPAGYLTGYPANTDNTHDHLLRPDVRPCRHAGPCNNSCECVRNQVTCEKACACPPNCPRKWRGCSCKRGGRPCSTDKCICKKANRECDPDLCGTCGAVELLDPVNRYNSTIATPDMCQLVNIQREVTRKTLLGISVLSGYGLWVCEDIPKNGYIGEYKGEIITNGESERRGRLYDVRAMSFLFTLNSAQVIDATRMGNKFRFVNNSQVKPNCYAKVLLANCAHRIGFFALRAIRAGEELFFDYGYRKENPKWGKFVRLEPPPLPKETHSDEEESVAPLKPANAGRSRGYPEYLRGGKGTTARSRGRISPAVSENTESTRPRRVFVSLRQKGRKTSKSNEYVQDSSTDVPTDVAPEDTLSEYEETQEEFGNDEDGDEDEGEGEDKQAKAEAGKSDNQRIPLKRLRRSRRVVHEEPPAKKGRWSGGASLKGPWPSSSRMGRTRGGL